MLDPKDVAGALLDTISAMADGHELFEANEIEEFTCGQAQSDLPPSASVASQLWMPVKIDGVEFAVVAYQVAG